jgi:hypothetical protein
MSTPNVVALTKSDINAKFKKIKEEYIHSLPDYPNPKKRSILETVGTDTVEQLRKNIQNNLSNNTDNTGNNMIVVELTKYNQLSNQKSDYVNEFIAIVQEIWDMYNRARVNKKDPPTFIEWVNTKIEKNAFNKDMDQLQGLKWCFSILQELGPVIGPQGIPLRTDLIQQEIQKQINQLEQQDELKEPPKKTPRRSGGLRKKTKGKTKKKTNKKRKTKRRKTRRLKLKNN